MKESDVVLHVPIEIGIYSWLRLMAPKAGRSTEEQVAYLITLALAAEAEPSLPWESIVKLACCRARRAPRGKK